MRDTTTALRNAVLGIFGFGAVGSLAELILLGHYEDPWQYAPLILIAVAGAVTIWHVARPTASTLRAFQLTMGLFVVTGLLGVWLHFEGAAEFQREIDPSIATWTLVTKAVRSKAPPVLAPGLLTQLGLLGFAYSYRYPALTAGGTVPASSKVTS